jgi:cobalt-zinc-cadmium efflux system membrane fusion protein
MKILKTALLLLGLSSAALFAADATFTLSEEQFKNLGVTLGRPEAVQQAPLLNAPAQVVVPPAHEYVVSAAQPGLINRLNAAAGDTVNKGQTLAVIDSPDLLMLQQSYLQAAGQSRLASEAYRRDKKLHDEGVIADRRWQETAAQYGMQTSAENEAKQLLAVAGMSDADIKRLAATRRLSSQLLVYAPAGGVVLERMAKTGERVAAQEPLYRIANLDELWLEIAVPQQRAQDIKAGDRVTVENTGAGARITLLGRSVDPQTQTVLGRAAIDVGHGDVRVGQTVNAQIVRISAEPLFKLPDAAVAQNAGQAYVFSRTAEGFAVKPVRVTGKQGGYSFVGGALQADENVAVSGAVALKANWLGLGQNEGNE